MEDVTVTVTKCDVDDCPFHTSHFDRDMEYTATGAVWRECLHPGPGDDTPALPPFKELKASNFAIPAYCPLHRRGIAVKLSPFTVIRSPKTPGPRAFKITETETECREMKTLTPIELAKLQLQDDEAILIMVEGGHLTDRETDSIADFIDACRRGETPVGLILDHRISITTVKSSEISTKMGLLEDGLKPGDS